MAPRRSAPIEEDEQEQDVELATLQFNDPLSWRAGKPIEAGELLRRLDKLSKELADMDQEATDKDSLTKVAKELVNHNLLGHKDKGVKAFAACCLVDILRICAPHAPFTHAQLKDVFNLFVTTILPALQDPRHTYNNQHKYVLVSLAEVQSIVLLNDVENNDNLLLHLFSSFFDAISATKPGGEQVSKDVELHMTEILATLIDEGANLPPKVVEVIMAQFLRAATPGGSRDKTDAADQDESQSTLLLKDEPAAYQMAKSICNSCSEKMSRFVAQYFSDVIMDFSGIGGRSNGQKGDDSDDEDMLGPSDADLKDLRKAHLLLRELWRAAPSVLPNVVPQLDAELSADNVHLRQLATETLGDMISGIGAAGPPANPALDPAAYPPLMLTDDAPSSVHANILTKPSSPQSFAQTHSEAYHKFVNRKNDKSAVIRAAWTTAVGYILSTSAGGIGLSREEEEALVKGLGEKLNDSDEKVRLAAVKAIETFSFKDVIAKLAPNGGISKEGSVLGNLADRCRDRRSHVRVEAMALLGKLWAAASGELAAGNEAVVSALSAIPSRIFNAFYANDLELNVLLDRVTFEFLVPLSYPPSKKGSKAANGGSQTPSAAAFDQDAIRAERILLLVRSLDAGAKRAFFAMQARQPQFSKVVETFLNQCELFNGGVMEEDEERTSSNLEKAINYLAQFLPDPIKVKSDLHKFAKANDRRNYQLVRFVTGREHDFKTMHRALKELVRRLHGANTVILDTLVPLLYRSGCIMFNRSHLSTILQHSKAGQDETAATAQELLNEMSQRNPDLFKTHIVELCKDLVTQAPSASKENEPNVVETLKACSSYSQKYPQDIPGDRKFTQTLMDYALYVKPAKAAKHAVNILLAKKDDKSLLSATELLQKALKGFSFEASHFPNKLVTISQLALLAPEVTADAESGVIDTASKILKNVRVDANEKDPEWVDESDLDEECQVKILCLKFLVKKLRGRGDVEAAKDEAQSLIRLLIKFVTKQGEMCKTKDTPKPHKARLRLVAALTILRICTMKHFEELLSAADFNELATIAQASQPQVRRGFIEKLQKYLVQNKLRPRFYTIIFLAAFEPINDFKQRIETWVRSRARYFQHAKQNVMEAAMARLLSLLAHHPDYSVEVDELLDHARYLVFYISNIANESNLGLIYKYAERVKQTVDAIDADKSENLYVLSDLAQSLIRKWQEKRNWTFEAYPGKIGVPLGLYSVLPSHDVAQKIAEKQYIPDGIEDRLDDLIKVADRKKKRKSIDDRHQALPPNKKAKSQPKATQSREPKAAAPKKVAKPKAPARPKKPKKTAIASSSQSDAARRRSGRSGAKGNQSYMERDSDQDDEEMLDGVAKWDYYKNEREDGGIQSPPADRAEDEDDAAEPVEEDQPPEESEGEEEDGAEEEEDDGEEEEEEKEKTPPPKANGRRGRSTAAPAKSSKPKPKPKPVAPKAKPAPKAAPARAAAKPTRGKAAKSAAKDVYDMDEDD